MVANEGPKPKNNYGPLLVLAAATLWGTTGTCLAFAPPAATPLSVGGVRMVIGGGALLAYAAARGQLRSGNRIRLGPVILGAGTVALYQVAFFSAVALTGVAVGTVVGIGSAPVAAGLISLLLDRRRPPGAWWAATALAIAGVALLTLAGGGVQVNPLGILLALVAGTSYALYTYAARNLLVDQPPEMVNALLFCGAALLLAPLLLTTDLSWVLSPRGLAVALWLGLAATALSYVLYVRALRTVPTPTAVTLALMEPVTATLLGVFVLGETLTLPALVGMGLVFVGLIVVSLPARRAPAATGAGAAVP
jgi:DME family drug/metabolite transporter